jgi:two-component system, OmpR family, phosphate regulon sensor histidine kinase PhoR
MTSVRFCQTLLIVAVATTIVAVIGVGAHSHWQGRGGLATVVPAALVVAVVAVVQSWALAREQREQTIARRYLELLGHVEGDHPSPILNLESLPAIEQSSPWYRPLMQIRDYLAAYHDRQQQTEHLRTGLEIRVQRAQAELELLRGIVAGVGEPILAVNRYDEVLVANVEAEKLFGLAPAGQEKRRIGEWPAGEKFEHWLGDLRRRNAPMHRADEFEFQTPGGRRSYHVTAANLAAEGEVGGAVLTLRDVEAHQDVRKQHAEFVSAAGHEMRAPLAGIKAYVELLADGDAEDDASREEFLEVIHGQADRLQRLIDNLLNIARIEAGVVKVSKQSRGVNEVLTEASHVVAPSAEMKQIKLQSDLSPLYLGALVDRDMLLQAVINLLSNAVKYTPAGGQVTLRSRLADSEILIEVEDTGVGLGEEDCLRVFEKFYRVEKDKSMAVGTGLGLALAKHIVEDVHGGKLTVRSKLGVGSTFAFTLPQAARNN